MEAQPDALPETATTITCIDAAGRSAELTLYNTVRDDVALVVLIAPAGESASLTARESRRLTEALARRTEAASKHRPQLRAPEFPGEAPARFSSQRAWPSAPRGDQLGDGAPPGGGAPRPEPPVSPAS